MSSIATLRISAIVGFLAVALGAFGAHALELTLSQNGTLETWKTASLYHLVHAAVLLFIAAREPFAAWAWRLFAAGILIFSGSLYVLAVTNIKWLGAITPIGGVCLLAGWLALAIKPR
ncbi:MAG: DUF423 domain-containing protein [Verrucomicrobiota bacterium]|nr:DUF423 domain-containing protein [Verrucomicrobiota bacterium]